MAGEAGQKRYFWTDANYSAIENDFIIIDYASGDGEHLFNNYTLDNVITKKVSERLNLNRC